MVGVGSPTVAAPGTHRRAFATLGCARRTALTAAGHGPHAMAGVRVARPSPLPASKQRFTQLFEESKKARRENDGGQWGFGGSGAFAGVRVSCRSAGTAAGNANYSNAAYAES